MDSHLNKTFLVQLLEFTGTVLVTVSVLVLLATFYPVVKEELAYQFLPHPEERVVVSSEEAKKLTSSEKDNLLVPVDEDFGIVIPKIRANARVIADTNWQDSAIYQSVLRKGVAHAEGTAYPGEGGNVFLFSHSGVDFFEAARYNAVFSLLNKLVPGDEIMLWHQQKRYIYRVAEKKVVSPTEVEYLKGDHSKKTLTLMTCFPAGTTFQRLLVIAEEVSSH